MVEPGAIAVKSATGLWTAAGVWTGVVVAVLSVIGLIVKVAPRWKEIGVGADEKLRSEMWKDIEALKLSKEDTSRRLTMAEAKIAGQTVQIGQQRFVLQLVIGELEQVSPGNSVAKQARIMLREVQPAAMPHSDEMAELVEAVAKIDPPAARSNP